MINPNKFHSVEKTVVMFADNYDYDCSLTTKVIINQIDPDRNVSKLYEITRLPEEKGLPDKLSHPHEIKLYYPYYQAKPETPISWVENLVSLDDYVKKIRRYFNRGRIVNVKWASPLKGFFSRRLTYRQTKAILSFENRASRKLADKPPAIQDIDPTKINGFIKCDKYLIESWESGLQKHRYTAITSDPDMDAWIRSMKDTH